MYKSKKTHNIECNWQLALFCKQKHYHTKQKLLKLQFKQIFSLKWCRTSKMSKNLQSPTKLTEFAPLQPEEKPQTVSHFITKLFKLTRNEETSTSETANATQDAAPVWANDITETSSNTVPNIYPVDINEGRSLPNVLKRISNLLALKSNVFKSLHFWV